MNFSTASRVQQTIRSGDNADFTRGENRVKINDSANCVPPLSAEEAKKLGIKINVNWGELMTLLAAARRQYRTAFFSNQHFFNVTLPLAPAQYQSEWGAFISDQINRPMKRSLKYFQLDESTFAAVVCHGIGPRLWYHSDPWCPDYVAIEDLRIPTDTTMDFENLEWFAVRRIYTPGELLNEAFKPGSTWDKKAVANILRAKKEINWDYAPNHYDWDSEPEKFAELVKQDGGWYASDAMPGIPLWHFYFSDNTDRDNAGWFMCVVPAVGTTGAKDDQFLWKSEKPVAEKWQHLLHCQFGDLSNKAPFLYHSVRSLGFALMEPTFYTNLTRCRLLQHIHDNFNIWLRTTDPIEKARAQIQEFSNLGMLRAGVSVVPQSERHQIEADLVEMGMSQLKQLQQEASSSYTQSIDTGTQREQTAFETNVKIQQVNSMMSGLLLKAFTYETFFYEEICRRFCRPKSSDPDVKKFQERCARAGIGKQWLDVDQWDVQPVTPLGMGNPTVAQAAAKQLLEILPLLDPTAQQEAKHEIVLTITNDARKAARWVPLGKGRGVTDGQRDAQGMFGTLMQGVPVPPREGLPAIDQVEALLPLMAGKIVMMDKRDNMGTPEEIAGLQTVAQYVSTLIQQIGQDKNEKARVKQYGDALGKLMNQVKALSQRGTEARAKQDGNGVDPAVMAKIQSLLMQSKVKAQTSIQKAQLTQKLKEDAHIRDQRRADAMAFRDIERERELSKVKNRLKSTEE